MDRTGMPVDGRRAFRKALTQNYNYYICHYEAVRNKDLIPAIRKVDWFHVIADECHRLKGRKTQQTRAVKTLKPKFKTGMSGTPAEDKPQDLWSILNWLWPQTYRSFWKFVGDYCNPPETPIWMADGTFKALGDVKIGDKVIGWDSSKKLCVSDVLAIYGRRAPLVKATLASGSTIRCTPDHKWLDPRASVPSRVKLGSNPWVQLGHNPLGLYGGSKHLSKVVEVPDELTWNLKKEAMWLGGLYDGEGNINGKGNFSISQSPTHNPEVCDRIRTVTRLLGFEVSEDPHGGCIVFRFTGGQGSPTLVNSLKVKFLSYCEPSRKGKIVDSLLKAHFGRLDRVEKIEKDGDDEPVISMKTSTGNYVAWGYASKNCEQETVCQECGGVSAFENGPIIHTSRCTKTGTTFKKIVGVNKASIPALRREMSRYTVRRLKSDPGILDELPPKTYTDIEVTLAPRQRKAYDQMRKNMLAWIGEHEDQPLTAAVVVAQLCRLQQFALASAHIEMRPVRRRKTGQVELVRYVVLEEPSSKLAALEEVIDDHPNESFVVFSQFKSMANLVARKLESKNISVGVYTGDVREQSVRDKLVDEFQHGDIQVFVGTIAAGGESITLHRSSTCILLDRHWTPTKNEQAVDRLHRDGQKHPVQVIDIIARNTVDLGRRTKIAGKWNTLKLLLDDKVDMDAYEEQASGY
jgi:hypothetical protein